MINSIRDWDRMLVTLPDLVGRLLAGNPSMKELYTSFTASKYSGNRNQAFSMSRILICRCCFTKLQNEHFQKMSWIGTPIGWQRCGRQTWKLSLAVEFPMYPKTWIMNIGMSGYIYSHCYSVLVGLGRWPNFSWLCVWLQVMARHGCWPPMCSSL